MSLISIMTSISLGALHALEPGHGKTFLASYSLANAMNKKQIIKIIASMAVSHSVLLIVLALIVPVLFPLMEETLHFFIQIIASLLILFVGVKMLVKKNKQVHDDQNCACGHDHSKISFSNHQKLNMKNNSFRIALSTDTKVNEHSTSENRNPLLVGFINEIMPCPSALAVVGIAFCYSSAWLISLTMIAYVIGFISAMFLLLLPFVFLKAKFLKINTSNMSAQNRIQFVSGTIIILSGFYYLFLAFNHSH